MKNPNSQQTAMELLRQRRGSGETLPKSIEPASGAELHNPEPVKAIPAPKKVKGAVGRPPTANVLDWKQFSTMLPSKLIKELRKAAVNEDVEIREIVKRALENELGSRLK
jgi:hypothetical protein